MSSKEKYISVLVHKTNKVKVQPDTTARILLIKLWLRKCKSMPENTTGNPKG